ncbi:S8 family peptidase [Nonomuraea sp. NPDC004297]
MVRRKLTAMLALALAATSAVIQPASAEPSPEAGGSSDKAVTLITGDKVVVSPDGAVAFHAGPGRKEIRYVKEGTADDWTIIPVDVAGLVAKGVIDRRLFEVPKLIEDGLDDASAATLPLIVQYRQGVRAAAVPSATRTLASINAVVAEPPRGDAWTQLSQSPGMERIWLDAKSQVTLDRSVPQVGAPDAWQAGFTGEGVKVAVLDTGIDDKHPDLAGRVDAAQNFSDSADTVDRHGHGTHVASTIAGQGLAATPARKGVAPGARLLVGKVLNDRGSGYDSDVIAGMEWAAQQGAKVVNMSLGHDDSEGLDPVEQAVNRLTEERGLLFVISAGNNGPKERSLGSPGSADAALTVGAVDHEDQLAAFSSRGPRLGDGALKPDLTAPGVAINAAAAGSAGYRSMSGTSMAAPHVAGAAAILAQQHPDWTAQQLKATLVGTAKPGGALFENGSGRLDVARAVRQAVTADTGTLSFGHLRWPYEETPIKKTLTYRNAGTDDVTLDLAVSGDGLPGGLFTLGADQVKVPAGGSATVDVTASPKAGKPGGYGGRITATGSGATISTLVSLDKEAESYDLRIKLIDQLGTVPDPESKYMPVTLVPENGGTPTSIGISYGDSETPVRVAAGRYLAYAHLFTAFPDGHSELSVVPIPGLEVKADREVVFDAQGAKHLDITTDHADARTAGEEFTLIQERADGKAWGSRYSIDRFSLPRNISPDPLRFNVKRARTTTPGFRFDIFAQLAALRNDRFTGSPYQYNLYLRHEGEVPDELRVRDRDLAAVKQSYSSLRADSIGAGGSAPVTDDAGGRFGTWSQVTTPIPATPTWYFTPGIPWKRVFVGNPASASLHQTVEEAEPRTYKAGKRDTDSWNTAVVGTALNSGAKVERAADTVTAYSLPLWNPAGPGRAGPSSSYGSGRTTLLRDGKEVGSFTRFPQPAGLKFPTPAGQGNFQLVLEGTANPKSTELSTEVRTEFAFTSKGEGAIPLYALRAEPELDGDNAARAGLLPLPLRLERTAGGLVSRVTAEVSYDDGATWKRLIVLPVGKDRYQTALINPHRPGGFVSLRLTAGDTKGNTFTQTVKRAFRLK